MKCNYSCKSNDHLIARRQFLGGLAGGFVVGGLGALTQPAAAAKLAKDQKRVVVIYMSGGLSQLESWDPKPKTDTGGPFRAIPTAVPGTFIFCPQVQAMTIASSDTSTSIYLETRQGFRSRIDKIHAV